MPTKHETKEYYHANFSDREHELVISTGNRDKHGKLLYEMYCPLCKSHRGMLRKQAKLLPCKPCGQRGKLGKKGPKHNAAARRKLSEANKRNSPIGRNLTADERRIIHNMRSRLNQFIKQKHNKTVDLLGCSVPELKKHLESQFQPGMTWDNYGRTGWHIDHIKPLSSFDLTDLEQLTEACKYTNLQPLWAKDNIQKSNKL